MIASLRGIVSSTSSSSLVLDVNGIGYQVLVPKSVSLSAEIGATVFLHTTLVVREDNWQLFGFAEVEQQGLFDLLRSVSGVGPKTALAILSTLSAAEISYAVTNDDSKPFESVSGVGSKTAKLINVTLAGKLKSTAAASESPEYALLTALQGLGWNERTALPIVQSVLSSAGEKSEIAELIRECLALLSKSK